MDDGRFDKLNEVLQHYNAGMRNHAKLDAIFKTSATPGIRHSADEQLELIAFLKTLNDVDFIIERRFDNN
jgi:cytochrome c peroxidase